MREIKFRAWEPINKMMHYLDFCLYTGTEVKMFALPVDRQRLSDSYSVMNLDSLIIEQYTGLKDKNGREIYEGDIVKIYHVRLVSDGPIHQPRLASIEWSVDDCGFRLVGPDVRSTNPDLYPTSHLEVIGNIHENPELLK